MRTKLLSKSEIAAQKTVARNQEVFEGLKVSRKVDALRKLAAEEETKLEQYRSATLTEVQKEIDSLLVKKNGLAGEIREMQAKLDSMMPELSIKRKELAEFERNLVKRERGLSQKSDELHLYEIDIQETKNNLADLIFQQNIKNQETEQLKTKAQNLLFEAKQTRETAQKIEEKAYQLEKEKLDEIALRESNVASRESLVENRESNAFLQKTENEKEAIRLADMRRDLETALEQLRKLRK